MSNLQMSKEEFRAAKRKYQLQSYMAGSRGIGWELTLEEWITWWLSTGHYHERGNRKGQYVMSRIGDTGPYKIGNIRCITSAQNISEAHKGKKTPIEAIAKRLETQKRNNKPISEQTRKNLSESHKGKKQSAETVAKRVAKNKGQDRSAAWAKYYERKAANVR